ncbi:MAG: STAS domain-containing protein [Planctomycetes bacterium]|nr:STAS domain-containing protein [Planctomycetota bacterium]
MTRAIQHELFPRDDGARIAFDGEIDMHVAPELRKLLRKALEPRPRTLVLDMAKVPFIDSSGIATIVEALKLARGWSGTVRLEGCQDAVRDTFDIAGLTRLLGIA